MKHVFPFGQFGDQSIKLRSLTFLTSSASWIRVKILEIFDLIEILLPETTTAPAFGNLSFQKENHVPIPNFQVCYVSFREGNCENYLSNQTIGIVKLLEVLYLVILTFWVHIYAIVAIRMMSQRFASHMDLGTCWRFFCPEASS